METWDSAFCTPSANGVAGKGWYEKRSKKVLSEGWDP
jgi:hypothetical protein